MATINDLTKTGELKGTVKKPFTPSISQEPAPHTEAYAKQRNLNTTVNMANPNNPTAPIEIIQPVSPRSIINTQNSVNKAERTKVTIGDIDGAEAAPNINAIARSKALVKEKKILEGGIFDKYVANKTAEMNEYLAAEAIKDEVNAGATANETKTAEPEVDNTFEEEKEVEDIKPEQVTYKNIDIMNGVEKDETPVEDTTVEEVSEPEVSEVEETPVETVQEDETPIEDPEVTKVVDNTITDITSDDDEDTVTEGDNSDLVDDEDDSANIKLEQLKAMITEKIKPISKKLDITGFTIAKKGTSSSNIIKSREVSVAKWVLPTTGITISMKEISGSNLEKMRYSIQNNNVRDALNIIYDHIVSAKPDSFEAWMKSIAFEDEDHLFMAVYIAAFADSNYVPIDCKNKGCVGSNPKEKDPKNKNTTYITDNTPIMDMVKFKDKAAKDRFTKLYSDEPSESKGLYPTSIIPISENFAIGFVQPSIYTVTVEMNYMNDQFIEKYNNTVAMLPYIDNIYVIDKANQTLVPVTWKEVANNAAKNVRTKVLRYDKIFSTMSADEISVIRAYVNAIGAKSDDITYQLPETTCPYCHTVNKASEQTASSLVFLRNQLGLLVTT